MSPQRVPVRAEQAGVVVLGVDTGFSSVGWCLARMTRSALVPQLMGVHRTESSAKKLKIKVGDDDFSRSRGIAQCLDGLIVQATPLIITCEAFSPMRNSSTVAKVGRCFGVLAALSEVHDLPVLHATPMEIKKAVTGVKDASKDEVAAALDRRFNGAAAALLEKLPRGQWEHPLDALGSILACWDAEPMRLLRRTAC